VIGRESIKSLGSCKQTEPFNVHVKSDSRFDG
jgi:hypothetical protein